MKTEEYNKLGFLMMMSLVFVSFFRVSSLFDRVMGTIVFFIGAMLYILKEDKEVIKIKSKVSKK